MQMCVRVPAWMCYARTSITGTLTALMRTCSAAQDHSPQPLEAQLQRRLKYCKSVFQIKSVAYLKEEVCIG